MFLSEVFYDVSDMEQAILFELAPVYDKCL